MKFASLVVPTVALALSGLSLADTTVTVSYDKTYDKGSTSLDKVACSNGENGLEPKGYTTFDSLPDFPFIGGASVVAGWNSPNCGTCWKLTYKNSKGQKTSVTVLAIDHADKGFNVALEAMDDLTNGQSQQLGRVNATAKEVPASECGL